MSMFIANDSSGDRVHENAGVGDVLVADNLLSLRVASGNAEPSGRYH